MLATVRIQHSLLFLLLFSSLSAGQTLQVTDAAGRSIHLERPAERIISLAPHLTENLFAIGAGEQLVGAVAFSDYPEAALNIPRVGQYNQFDAEAILALQPDLILAWHSGNPRAQVQRLKRLGLTVFYSESRTFEDIAEELNTLGRLTGRVSEAAAAAAKIDNGINELQQSYTERQRLSVFYQVWDQPLMTINGEHLISQMLDLCGGDNLFAKSRSLTPRIDRESLLQANPQVILGGSQPPLDEEPDWLRAWRAFPQLQAVQHSTLYTVNSDWVTRPTLRAFKGAQAICQRLDEARAKLELPE